jgi:hypothetical protein
VTWRLPNYLTQVLTGINIWDLGDSIHNIIQARLAGLAWAELITAYGRIGRLARTLKNQLQEKRKSTEQFSGYHK